MKKPLVYIICAIIIVIGLFVCRVPQKIGEFNKPAPHSMSRADSIQARMDSIRNRIDSLLLINSATNIEDT